MLCGSSFCSTDFDLGLFVGPGEGDRLGKVRLGLIGLHLREK